MRRAALPGYGNEWRYVFEQGCVHAGHAMRADATILMNQGEASEKSIVADMHMPGETRCIRENCSLSDAAVMRDMTVGHDEIVVTDDRLPAALDSPAIQRTVLAYGIAIADGEARGLALVADMLWRVAERTKLKYTILTSDASRTVNHDVRTDPAAGADVDVGPDDRICADRHTRIQPRAGIDDCRWMYHDRYLIPL